MKVQFAETEIETRRGFPVMSPLRPHLHEAEFVSRVRRQQDLVGYTLAFLEDQCQVKTVAGFRLSENRCDGKYLYVDDW